MGMASKEKRRFPTIEETHQALPGKSKFSHFMFNERAQSEFKVFVDNVEKLKSGNIADPIHDGQKIGIIVDSWDTGKKEISLFLNYENTKKIIHEHGELPSRALVHTANNFDVGVFIKGIRTKKDKINLIKVTSDGGVFVLGANRINGYGVVTFFEQYHPRQAKEYLALIMRRGIPFSSRGRRILHPSP
jgi:hypothetical protein